VAEWFKAPVLKTGVPARVPWVRIPPLPPLFNEINGFDTLSRGGFDTFRLSSVLRNFPKPHPIGRHHLAPRLLNVLPGFIVGQVPED
jgi:hypothetical protein